MKSSPAVPVAAPGGDEDADAAADLTGDRGCCGTAGGGFDGPAASLDRCDRLDTNGIFMPAIRVWDLVRVWDLQKVFFFPLFFVVFPPLFFAG